MARSPLESFKLFKRGETLFSVGEPADRVYLLQSGIASVSVARAGRAVEISQVNAPQLLGQEALWGFATWGATAVANNDVRVIEVPIARAQELLSNGSPLLKVYGRAILAKQKAISESLLEIKLESDPVPCPPKRVTQLFAVIFHVSRQSGTRKGDSTTVVWPAFKKYAQRVFLESPVRLEQAVNLLVKLGLAQLEMVKCETDPEAPDELGFVHFNRLERVQAFFQAYRQHHYSGDPTALTEGDTDGINSAILREIEAWNRIGKVEVA